MNETINFGDPIDFFYQSKTLYDLEKLNKISLNRGEVIAKPKKEGKYPVYSSSIHNDGLFAKIDNFMFDEELITWSIDGGGDFFYRSKHKFSVTNVSGYLRVLDKETIDTKYLYYLLSYLHSSKHFDYQTKAHPSVIRDLYVFNIPNIKIQKELSSLLFNLEGMLKHMKTQLNMTKVHKKSMLYKMFPKRESNLPEIRFSEFTEIWDETTLENNCSFYKGKGYSKKDLTKSGTQLFLYGRLYTNYANEVCKIDTFTKYTDPAAYVSTGNEIVIPSSGETAEDISRATAILSEGIILGGDLNILVPNDNFYTPFLSLLITHSNFHIELSKKAQGKTVVHVHNDDIKDITFLYPKKEEQKRIVEFFRNLDKFIAYQEKEITTLERLKDTLLKKMFA